jgi:hypothetical protein
MLVQSTEKFTLKMVEKIDMPESIRDSETGKFKKTGNTVEMYGYTFIGTLGMEKLFFMKSPEKLDLRDKEGKLGYLALDVVYDDYSRKTKTQLLDFTDKPLEVESK